MVKKVFLFLGIIGAILGIKDANCVQRGNKDSIIISGYGNYYPYGFISKDNVWQTAYNPAINQLKAELKKNIIINSYNLDELATLATDIREAKIDLFIGAYNQTERFENLHLLFPAIVYNPVTFFVLPTNIASIKSADDLLKLKGIRYSSEIFSDFVEKNLEKFNLEKSDSWYDIFEKLFTHNVDYVISGYYYGTIEAIKLGLLSQIAISKQALWNIPVFVGIAQMSPYRDMLARHFSRYVQDEKIVAAIKSEFQNILNEYMQKYSGVVPPTFGLEDTNVVINNKSVE